MFLFLKHIFQKINSISEKLWKLELLIAGHLKSGCVGTLVPVGLLSSYGAEVLSDINRLDWAASEGNYINHDYL